MLTVTIIIQSENGSVLVHSTRNALEAIHFALPGKIEDEDSQHALAGYDYQPLLVERLTPWTLP